MWYILPLPLTSARNYLDRCIY